MSDTQTPNQRHYNMSRIRAKNTKPEIIVRRYLWSRGFRYRLNHPRLPGKPDVVLRKYRTCVFVNGCFWHGHNIAFDEVQTVQEVQCSLDAVQKVQEVQCSLDAVQKVSNSECCKIPKTNRGFWVRKIARNMERDVEVQKKLATMGWHSITIWECELKPSKREKTLESLAFTLNHIFLNDHKVTRYEIPEEESCRMVAEEI